MTKLTSRAKQALETKNRIYECGVNLIGKHGFDQITVEQIASEAGVSVGTYYYYFESKFELFKEMFKRADEYFLNKIADNLESSTAPEKIVEFFEKYADFTYETEIEIVKKIYISDNKMFITENRPMQAILQSIIEKGQASGEFSKSMSSIELTNMLFLVGRGVIFDWCLRDGTINLKETMKKVIGIVTKGLN
ncbi:TetR/AcrR family transcriptional regulator [Pelosinus propionicus]|uniref:DNA-binding transcriptional regulator, AcrR family n=1 Tax=Pelosinus propionicus DSM 13327 TaxID=1123291 RepID=A0A1I4MAA6_9FIRM|nr:TetR/AcrR family transcriptional regulator [Pelosinus propionicus]SFM00128.1 DNA-binding transcriptional regulator, AcrR family [Pelosinus propionicus DSM 13327]